jgi:hypothetical protein
VRKAAVTTRVVELALMGRIPRVERIGIGLIGICRAMAQDNDAPVVAQRGNPGGDDWVNAGTTHRSATKPAGRRLCGSMDHFSSKARENKANFPGCVSPVGVLTAVPLQQSPWRRSA